MDYRVKSEALTQSAESIRSKSGSSASIPWDNLTGFKDAIDAIPTGGGSTLITKTITVNGTYSAQDDDADGYSSVTVNVPSTSGGSVVTGTFTGSAAEKGTAKAITVPYSGTGYPISISIFPTAGSYKSGTDLYNSTQTKAIVCLSGIKCDVSLMPDYTNNAIQNYLSVASSYKNSATDSTNIASSYSKNSSSYYRFTASGNNVGTAIRFYNSATNLSVYIAPDGGTEYGFLAGTEYTYVIQYSS